MNLFTDELIVTIVEAVSGCVVQLQAAADQEAEEVMFL